MSKKIFFSTIILTMGIALLVLLGWFTHNDLLRSVFTYQIMMKFNTALCFILTASALLLHNASQKNKLGYKIANALVVIVLIFGLITLAEYFMNFNFGIDEFFMADDFPTTDIYFAGRMSPISAIVFTLAGICLLYFNKEKSVFYQFIALSSIAFISLIMLIGLNFIADIPTFIRIAVHTAIGFMALACAIYSGQSMFRKKISFEFKLITGFSSVIMLILLLGLFTNYYNNKRGSTSHLIEHTNMMLGEAEQILNFTNNTENQIRDYVENRTESITEFDKARFEIFDHIDKLEELTSGNKQQQSRIDSLAALVQKQISFSILCIEEKDLKGIDAAGQLLDTRVGEIYAEKIREKAEDIEQEEYKSLTQNQKENDKSTNAFNRSFFIFLGSVFILLVAILFSIRRNISFRKKTERQAKENEDQIQTIFNAAPDPVILIDEEGIIVKWNPKAENILGWTSGEVIGRSLSDTIVPQRFRDAHVKGLKKYLETGTGTILGKTIELRAVNKSNIEFDVALSVSSTISNGKNLFVGFIRDITEQKKTQLEIKELNAGLEQRINVRTEELLRSEKNYRDLFDNNPIPTFVMDLSFKFLDANKAAISHYGYSREEFLLMTVPDIIPEEDRQKLTGYSISNYKDTRNTDVWRNVKKDGTVIHVDIKANEIVFNNTEARLVLATDVTERLKIETKIKLSEANLKGSQAIAHLGSWEFDFTTCENTWSEECCRIYGLTPEENIQTFESWSAFLHPEDIDRVMKIIKEGESLMKVSPFHHRIIRRDGSIRHLYSEAHYRLNEKGIPIGLYGIAHDVTESHIAEEEKAKLAADVFRRNKELEQFAYIISHNLRSPVANIIGFTEELVMESNTEEEKATFLSELALSAKNLDEVIIDLNSILNSKQEINEAGEKIELPVLIHNIETSIINLINKKNVKIKCDFTEVQYVTGVKSYIYSIFQNLITNSIKYKQTDTDPVIEIKAAQRDGKVILTFEDNGMGIDLAKKGSQVFGLYKRFHPGIEGKGMGLYMVKSQVESLGGTINIQSNLNIGTKFIIELPDTKEIEFSKVI